jgi:hypothetical protein
MQILGCRILDYPISARVRNDHDTVKTDRMTGVLQVLLTIALIHTLSKEEGGG